MESGDKEYLGNINRNYPPNLVGKKLTKLKSFERIVAKLDKEVMYNNCRRDVSQSTLTGNNNNFILNEKNYYPNSSPIKKLNKTFSDYGSVYGTLISPETTEINDVLDLEETQYKPPIKERKSNLVRLNQNEICKINRKFDKNSGSKISVQLVAPSCSPRLEYGQYSECIKNKNTSEFFISKSNKIDSYNLSNKNKARKTKQSKHLRNKNDLNVSLISETINTTELSPRTQSISLQSIPDETITKLKSAPNNISTPHVRKTPYMNVDFCSSRLTEEGVDNNFKSQTSLNFQSQQNQNNYETNFSPENLREPNFSKNIMVNSACSPMKSIISEKSDRKNFLKPVLSYHNEYTITSKNYSSNGSIKSRTESVTSVSKPKKDLLDEIDEILHEESQKYENFHKPFESRNIVLKSPSNQNMSALKNTAEWVYSNKSPVTTFLKPKKNYENDPLNQSGENMVKAIDQKVDEVERYLQETTAKIAKDEMKKIKNLLKKL